MKKIATIVLSALLIFSLASIFASAENTVNPDGFRFDIKAINGSISGEDGIIITSQDAIANANLKWPVVIICEKVSDGVYKVKQDPIVPKGTVPEITLNQNEIIIAIHSSSSDLSTKDTYKNVEQKLAALNVKAGMYFTFEGIDLVNGTCENGVAICSAQAPGSESSTSQSESSTSTETSSTSTSSTSASSTESKNTSQESSSKTATSSTTSSQHPKTGDAGTIANIIIAIMALAGAATVAVKKRSR